MFTNLAILGAPGILWVPRRKGFHFPRGETAAPRNRSSASRSHRRCRRVAVLGPLRFSEVRLLCTFQSNRWKGRMPMKWPVEFDDTPWDFGMLQVPCQLFLDCGFWRMVGPGLVPHQDLSQSTKMAGSRLQLQTVRSPKVSIQGWHHRKLPANAAVTLSRGGSFPWLSLDPHNYVNEWFLVGISM